MDGYIDVPKDMELTDTNIKKYCYKKDHEKAFMRTGDHGLTLCVNKKGKCFFRLRYKLNNKKNWYSIGEYPAITLSRANYLVLGVVQMLKEGKDPHQVNKVIKEQAEKVKIVTVGDLVDKYLPIILAKRKEGSSSQGVKYPMGVIKRILGKIDIKLLAQDDIENKLIIPHNDRPAQAKKLYNAIQRLINYAIRQDYIIVDPTRKIELPVLSIPNTIRDLYMTRPELSAAFNALYQNDTIPEQYKIALHLLLMLMVRKMDLLANTWANVDIERKEMLIANTKNGTNLVVPLPEQAIKLLKIILELDGGEGFIFKGKIAGRHMAHNTLCVHWDKVKNQKAANSKKTIINDKDIKLHDFRHTSSTLLHSEAFRPEVIECALNHVKKSMWGRYNQHEYQKERAEMLQHWADLIDGLIDPTLLPYGKKY